MFVTTPPFEQLMPRELVGSTQKCWRAVTLSLDTPWYLFAYEAHYDGQGLPQTTLVAWETTLLDILSAVPAEDHRAIARLEKGQEPDAKWVLRWVEKLWSPGEGEETGTMLLQLEGDPQMRDAHLNPVSTAPGRRLLYCAQKQSEARPRPPHE